MATSVKHKGWRFDVANSRLNMEYDGDPSAYIDASGLTVPSGETLTVSGTFTGTNKVKKADLATGVYAIEHICAHFTSPDNETIGITSVWSACTVVRVAYWTSSALGSSVGIDILDGSTDGAGTTVIDSCSDNLSGFDVNDLTTPHVLSANDYLLIKFDNFTTTPSDITVDIQLKVPLTTAT